MVISADLPRADHPAADHALGTAEDGDDQQAGEHHLHRRLHRRPLWQVAATGNRRGPDLPGRRTPVHRPATQGHRARRESADRSAGSGRGHQCTGHRSDRVAGARPVHHPVRHPQSGCHGAPPRHGAGSGLRIAGEAAGLHCRGCVRDLRPVQRLRRPVHPGPRHVRTRTLLGRSRQLAGHGGADRYGHDRHRLPAEAVSRVRGGEHRAQGPAPGTLGLPCLPRVGGSVRGAHRPGRPDAAAAWRTDRLLRHQPATGRSPSAWPCWPSLVGRRPLPAWSSSRQWPCRP